MNQFHRPRAWLIGGCLLLALIVLVQWLIGWPAMLAPWRTFSPLLLGSLLALTLMSYLLRAWRVQRYFAPQLDGRLVATFKLSALHTTANVLLPMRLGELAFPWLMRRYFGHNLLATGVALLWIRVLDVHCLVLFGWIALWLHQPNLFFIIAALLWVGTLGWLQQATVLVQRWRPPPRWATLLQQLTTAVPQLPGQIVQLYLLTVLSWLTKLIAFAVVLQQVAGLASWQALAGALGAELSSVLPIHGIAGAGSYEVAAVAALVPLGVDASTALAAAVNLHLFMLAASVLIGTVALLLPHQAVTAATNTTAPAVRHDPVPHAPQSG